MKSMISAVLLVSLIVLTNVCLGEVIFEDDFTGTEIDVSKWIIHETPSCSQTATVTQNEELIIELPPDHNNCGSWGVVSIDQFSQFTDNVSYEVDYRTTTLHNSQDIPMNFYTPIGNIQYRNYGTRWIVMWNNESGGEMRLVVITESMTEAVYHLKIEIDNGILKFWRAVGTGDYVLLHSVNEGEFSLGAFESVGLYSSDRGHSYYDNLVVEAISNGPPPPVLVSPVDGAPNVPIEPTVFTFDEVSGYGITDYQIVVATDEQFQNIAISNFAYNGEYQTGLLENETEYFWRMRSYNGDWGEWTGVWSFTTGDDQFPPPPPVLVSPIDGAPNVPIEPTVFTFDEVSGYGITDYQIVVATDEQFQNIVISNFAINGEYQTDLLENETEYFWRMRSFNGEWGEWSEEWSFLTIGFPNYSECYILGEVFDATQTEIPITPENVRIALLRDTAIIANYDVPIIISKNHFFADLEPFIGEDKPIALEDLYSTDVAIRLFIEIFGPEDYDPTKIVDRIIYNEITELDIGLVPGNSEVTYLKPWEDSKSHFDIHYEVDGVNRVPHTEFTVLAEGYNDRKVPVFINEIAKYLEYSWQAYVDLGFWDGYDVFDIKVSFDNTYNYGQGWANNFPDEIILFNSFKEDDNAEDDEFKSYGIYKQTSAHEMFHHVIYKEANDSWDWIDEGMAVLAGNAVFHYKYIDMLYSSQFSYMRNGPRMPYKNISLIHNDYYYGYIYSSGFWKYLTEYIGTISDFHRIDGSLIALHGMNVIRQIIPYLGCDDVEGCESTINNFLEDMGIQHSLKHILREWAITNAVKEYNLPSEPDYTRYHYKEYVNRYSAINPLSYQCPYITAKYVLDTDPINIEINTFPEFSYRYLHLVLPDQYNYDKLLVKITSQNNNVDKKPVVITIAGDIIHNIETTNKVDLDGIDEIVIVLVNGSSEDDNEVSLKIQTKGYMQIAGHSPIDLRVTSPCGEVISKNEESLNGAVYEEIEMADGDRDDFIYIPFPDSGIYSIEVIPDDTAGPTSTYSLEYSLGSDTVWLATDALVNQAPMAQYYTSTLDTGSIHGFVQSVSAGLMGVPVDLYDSAGTIISSIATDDSGYYHFPTLINGSYSVGISTPLGYQAENETQEIVVRGLPHEVNFELNELEITPQQRSRGYWAHQLHKAIKNRPKDYTLDDFSNFASLINSHFNQNTINPVDFYTVPQPADQSDSLQVLKKLLHMRNTGEWEPFLKRLAKSQLMALMLNVVSGKVSQTHEISVDGRTVSQAITYCDMLVNDEIDPPDDEGPGHGSPWCRYIRASFILGFVNLGITAPTGIIPEDVIQIAYRIHSNEEIVPDEFTLNQNYPNPFNPVTEISFNLPHATDVKLEIFNIMGQKITTLIDKGLEAGSHKISWDGSNVASGVYFYRIQAGELNATRKMVLLK